MNTCEVCGRPLRRGWLVCARCEETESESLRVTVPHDPTVRLVHDAVRRDTDRREYERSEA